MTYAIEIKKGGYYPSVVYAGKGDNLQEDGVLIDAPNEVVYLGNVEISQVKTPITIVRAAYVFIDTYHIKDYWGDGVNLRQSNLHIKHYYSEGCKLRLPYEMFHVDAVLQAFAVKADGYSLDKDGVIENVRIDYLDVNCTDPEASVIMLSEFNRYSHFYIGTEYLHLNTNTPFWINANNLSNSIIGGMDVSITSPNRLKSSLLISDRAKQGVCSTIDSNKNIFINIPNLDIGKCGKEYKTIYV